ncbi:helix-turn-helix domain-containing protein [Bacteroidales bacterium OttesenSCG-928-I14]|nr:helix-turn-helix domain-containing protein [Bacteroidales bacterium OttesenSCG-928-I14]
MKERIKIIIDKSGLNVNDFADSIGINRQTFIAALNRNQTVNTPILTAILENYEDINTDWLMLGKGNMLRNEKAFLEPSLFPAENEENPIQSTDESEFRKKTEVKKPVSPIKASKNEVIMGEFISSKKIDKIVIFYTDNTFMTFCPEE